MKFLVLLIMIVSILSGVILAQDNKPLTKPKPPKEQPKPKFKPKKDDLFHYSEEGDLSPATTLGGRNTSSLKFIGSDKKTFKFKIRGKLFTPTVILEHSSGFKLFVGKNGVVEFKLKGEGEWVYFTIISTKLGKTGKFLVTIDEIDTKSY